MDRIDIIWTVMTMATIWCLWCAQNYLLHGWKLFWFVVSVLASWIFLTLIIVSDEWEKERVARRGE